MNLKFILETLFCSLAMISSIPAMDIPPIDANFFSRHDLVWDRMPPDWGSGAFQGNGLLGAMISQKPNSDSLRWHIGRTDVYFTAKPDNQYRVPIGDFVWPLSEPPVSFSMRLDLWNADVKGTLKPDAQNELKWSSFTASGLPVQIIRITASSGRLPQMEWVPSPAINARAIIRKEVTPEDEINPTPVLSQEGDISYCLQSLRDGNEYVTAWTKVTSGKMETYYLTVAFAPAGKAKSQATETLMGALKGGL